jgi:nucleolin
VSNRSVYVGNLSFDVQSQELAEHFDKAGRVVYAKVVCAPGQKQHKGFAFVEYQTEEDALNAVKVFHDTFMKGRRIRVALATN